MSLSNAGCRLGWGVVGLAFFAFSSGCNSLDVYVPPAEDEARLVIPTDVRPVELARETPPPVVGGTLLVTRSGLFAVASDVETDTIAVVRLDSGSLHGVLQLEPGDEPGRLVEDANGIVHVALRRGGAIVAVDPATPSLLDRRAVCGAPRGLAVTPNDTLTVACADGKLVTLPTSGGAPTRTLVLEPDLRDVIPTANGVAVTRFKSAEVLRVDGAGSVSRRDRLPLVQGMRSVPVKGAEGDLFFTPTEPRIDAFSPRVAWRTVTGANGALVMVHQRAVEAEVEITEPTLSGSSYGGSDGLPCGGIVQNAVTVIGSDGGVTNLTVPGVPLPVDATLLPDQRTLLIVHAGPPDGAAPRPFVTFPADGATTPTTLQDFGGSSANTLSVVIVPDPTPAGGDITQPSADPGCSGGGTIPITDPAVAVAYNPTLTQQIVVQTRQPSQILIIDDLNNAFSVAPRAVALSRPSDTRDTGFELFHRDSGGGIACASCHPEGGEDGKIWSFSITGPRRTQPLDVGLEGTAPFHWDGELGGLGELMSEVFVARMGGIHESEERLASLQRFVFALEPVAPIRDAADEAAGRGKVLFESAEIGCAACHSGERLTNNLSYDVGTRSDRALQVPSLVGVGYRAPFMHDGCAPTLAARFDPSCGGGEQHGFTAALSAEQVADLVAYLEAL